MIVNDIVLGSNLFFGSGRSWRILEFYPSKRSSGAEKVRAAEARNKPENRTNGEEEKIVASEAEATRPWKEISFRLPHIPAAPGARASAALSREALCDRRTKRQPLQVWGVRMTPTKGGTSLTWASK